MPRVAVTLATDLAAPIAPVFDFVVAEDVLPKILLGYGPVPAVLRTSDQHGAWDTPGAHRIVHLAGGGTAREAVLAFRRPTYFAYRVSQFSFALKHIATAGRGQWWFAPHATGTHVIWTYTFTARSWPALPLLWLIARWGWRGYMRVALDAIRRQLA